MIFKSATIHDLPEMKQLYVSTIREVCKNDYDAEQIETWSSSVDKTQRWLDVVTDQYVLLAEVDGTLAGYGTLKDWNYIDFFYVNKDFQRMGIAKALLDKLEKTAIEHGVDLLSSDISITAKPFFEKSGYRVIAEQKNLRGTVILINYKMEKKLK